MKIVMFSMTPLFPDRAMGGAQKQLKRIAVYLAERDHDVTVLATRRADSLESFRWHERAQVVPIFRFKQPYPEPYDTPVFNLAAAVQDLGDSLRDADRFYLHDGGFVFPYVYRHVPTVVSLRALVFPETMQSAFLFRGDRLILVSEHQVATLEQTAGRFFPGYADRIRLIHNGFDWSYYQPTPTDEILKRIPVDPADDLVLYPHRPDASKGIFQTIAVADKLVHEYGLSRLRVLVPMWIDTTLAPDVKAFYDGLRQQIDQRGLTGHFVFHDWIPEHLMPAYYSLGRVTLCLGSVIEAFGNVAWESLGCGTPAIVVRVASNRELFPEALSNLIDFGDIETAAALAADIIHQRKRTSPAMRDFMRARYGHEKMLSAYEDVIVSARHLDDLIYRYTPIDDRTCFRLAPWCYRSARGIYHDFLATYHDDPLLIGLVGSGPFTLSQAAERGAIRSVVMDWYRDGYLVPERKD